MNELARRPTPPMTADEFLLWDGDGRGRKLHLIDGKVVEMPPASAVHGTMQSNLSQLILNAIDASGAALRCLSEGAIIPGLHHDDNVRVPDIVVAPEGGEPGDVVVTDPLVLIEILSPGNAPTTRDNVRAYATLPSVREIAAFSSSRMEAELYVRMDAGAWPARPEVVGPGGRLVLPAAGLHCPIERVYARTWLAARRAR